MQNQTLSHALATNTQTKTPYMAKGTIIYPGANVQNLGFILDSSLGPEFRLSTSPTVGMENSERCPVALLLIVLAATVLVPSHHPLSPGCGRSRITAPPSAPCATA